MFYLGIEIGGTKLQLGLGTGEGPPLDALVREEIDRTQGAEAIRRRIVELARPLVAKYRPRAIGIAFGGPIDVTSGCTLKSHHVAGWESFPLIKWSEENLGLPTVMGNDADLAGWAEAMYGAGSGHRAVFYITVGTGIGGALVYEGKVYTGAFGIAAELGHLRPGLDAMAPEQDLESVAAGWGIAARAQGLVSEILFSATKCRGANGSESAAAQWDETAVAKWRDRWGTSEDELVSVAVLEQAAHELLSRCHNEPSRLTTRMLGEALAEGNVIAKWVFGRALKALGWAIAQMITLVAPSAVVIGGGVSLLGEQLFFEPLRREVARYVFPALVGRYEILPAALGEQVMVHGAVLLARVTFGTPVTVMSSAHHPGQKE